MGSGLDELPFKNLREMVVDGLRRSILDGTLAPGQKLFDSDIAAKMGISRSPVREALRMLEKDGLVKNIPNRHTVVCSFSEKEVMQLYTIRAVLEGLAAAWACDELPHEGIARLRELSQGMKALCPFATQEDRSRYLELDYAFHDELISSAGSRRLSEFLGSIDLQLRTFKNATDSLYRSLEQAWVEHEQIVDALDARDCHRAERMARGHVDKARERMLRVIKMGCDQT